jgi:S-(hydroxymethyl)glutathione dehydrogenase/alcohol dehydrogenase
MAERTMRAAVFHGPQQSLTIEEVQYDKPMAHEIVVRTAATGVCHSDVHFVDGLYPMQAPAILGHEGAGIVEEVGGLVDYVKPGDHVICCPSVFCGQCDFCLAGKQHLCTQTAIRRRPHEPPKYTWHGSPVTQFANLSTYGEKMLLHENAVVKIDNAMPLDAAALIGCGVTTGVGAALNTAQVQPGSTVAVFGTGGVGLSAIQGARIAGARMIIALDVHEHKLATAKEMGATHGVDASSTDAVKAIRELSGGGVDYAFEAIGLKKAAEQCFDCIKPGGVATIIGMIPVGQKVELDGPSFLREKRIQGTMMGSNKFRIHMPQYIEFYRQGRLKLDEMITRRGKLEDVNEAMRAMKAGEVSRSVLILDEDALKGAQRATAAAAR